MTKCRLEISGEAFILQGNLVQSAIIFPEPKPFIVLNPKPAEPGAPPQTVFTMEEVAEVETGNLYYKTVDGSLLGSRNDVTSKRGNYFYNGETIPPEKIVQLIKTKDGTYKRVAKFAPTKVIKETESKWMPMTSIGKWIAEKVYVWRLSAAKADYNPSEYARTEADLFSMCEEWRAAQKAMLSTFVPTSKVCVSIWYPYIEKMENGAYKFGIVQHRCSVKNENYENLMEYTPKGIQHVEILNEPDTTELLAAMQ